MRLEAPVPAGPLGRIRAPFLAVGAAPFDAPTVQPLGQLLDLTGEAIRQRLFVLQNDGGEEACLRPDFTVAAARAHIESGAADGRYLYEGHAFRVAPRGAMRAEEFLQIGMEVFGGDKPEETDAEIAALAWRSAAAGGRADLALVFGDVALFVAFLASLDLPAAVTQRLTQDFARPKRLAVELTTGGSLAGSEPVDRLASLLAGLSERDAAEALEEVWRLSGIEAVGGRSAQEIAHRLRERAAAAKGPRLTPSHAERIERYLAVSDTVEAALAAIGDLAGAGATRLAHALDAWRRRLAALAKMGAPAAEARFVAAFGRAFGYYDGPLFEIRSVALGDDEPVAAGGRYDSLLTRLGAAAPCGAVGCIVRPGRAWLGAPR